MDIITKAIDKIFGSKNDKLLKYYRSVVDKINQLEPQICALSDEQLTHKTKEFKSRLASGQSLDSILPEAFATVREASKRVLNMRHFDVQLIGGMALHDGRIAEMRTGEGKTLVSTLPAYLNALTGKGVHIVTVNDYLAKRDSEWMGKVHRFLGLSVGCIEASPQSIEKFHAYQADITYGTNNEFGFDYLRDNLAMNKNSLLQRKPYFAIVDEVDSILIDEARTPLIISGPSEDKSELYHQLNHVVIEMKPEHYDLDEEHKTVSLNDAGYDFCEEILNRQGIIEQGTSLYDTHNIVISHHLSQALRAHKLFNKDKDYIIRNNSVMLIDEFSGRIMDGRRYSDGLHQAIEAKENVEIQPENKTLSSVTFQNYFRLYEKLSGMTGTALTEAAEFKECFNLEIIEIPTNNPVQRIDEEDALFLSVEEKYKAIIQEISTAQSKGQPVLVGTASIERSEDLSNELNKKGIRHQILNARYHEKEAHIIAQAGRLGTVTIATNMAGRGTDIQLGGSAEMRIEDEVSAELSEYDKELLIQKITKEVLEEKEKVLQAGGLLVIGTERHESRRIDNQLRGRSGRQGDPGRSRFYLCFDDDLLRIFGGEKLKNLFQKIGMETGQAIENKMLSNTIIRTQKKVEQRNYDTRRNLMKFDNILNEQRTRVFAMRREILEKENFKDVITQMLENYIIDLIPQYCQEKSLIEDWDIEGLEKHLTHHLGEHDYGIRDYISKDGIDIQTFRRFLNDRLLDIYNQKVSSWDNELSEAIHREVILRPFDLHWREHLTLVDHLGKIINFKGYGQKDPLIEFKKEAYESFSAFLQNKRIDTLKRIFLIQVQIPIEAETTHPTSGEFAHGLPHPDTGEIVSLADFPRNAVCPCGSGEKFKHCHGNPEALTRSLVI